MSPSSRQSEFWAGTRAIFPLIVGAIPFGIIFGALAINSGLSPAAASGMSAFVFAGSAQFIGVGLVAEGLPVGIIVLTTFVVNLRHALYAASLAPYMKHLPQRWLLPFGFLLTDEAYAATIVRLRQPDQSPYKHWFYFGAALLMYVNWQVCTLIGIVAGQQIPNAESWGLDFAMVVTFIGIIVPLVNNRAALASVIASGIVAVLANGLPNKIGLMVAALVGIAAGMIAEQVWPPEPELSTEEAAA